MAFSSFHIKSPVLENLNSETLIAGQILTLIESIIYIPLKGTNNKLTSTN